MRGQCRAGADSALRLRTQLAPLLYLDFVDSVIEVSLNVLQFSIANVLIFSELANRIASTFFILEKFHRIEKFQQL